MLLPASLPAKNIYKYQDENGIWHFTDRAPSEEVEFETVYMEREPEPRIKIRQEGRKESPVYMLYNDFWGPVEVELRFKEAVNVLSEPALPARFIIPAQTEQTLVGIGPLNEKQGFSYRLFDRPAWTCHPYQAGRSNSRLRAWSFCRPFRPVKNIW